MKNLGWFVFLIVQMFMIGKVEAVNGDELRVSDIVSRESAIDAEIFFIEHDYSHSEDSVDHELNMKVEDAARKIIIYLIQSGKETPQSLMKKFNEEDENFLTFRPILAFANGSFYFLSVVFHLKNYYDRHLNDNLLVSGIPLNITYQVNAAYQEKKPWYYPLTSLLPFSSSSTKTSQSSRSSESLSDGFDKAKKKD